MLLHQNQTNYMYIPITLYTTLLIPSVVEPILKPKVLAVKFQHSIENYCDSVLNNCFVMCLRARGVGVMNCDFAALLLTV